MGSKRTEEFARTDQERLDRPGLDKNFLAAKNPRDIFWISNITGSYLVSTEVINIVWKYPSGISFRTINCFLEIRVLIDMLDTFYTRGLSCLIWTPSS